MYKKSTAKNAIGLLALPVWKAPGTNTPPNQTARCGIGTLYTTLTMYCSGRDQAQKFKDNRQPHAGANGAEWN